MKTTTVIPPADQMAAHEMAAKEILDLRRKGVPCHLEEHSDRSGHRVDVVREAPDSGEEDRERRSDSS